MVLRPWRERRGTLEAIPAELRESWVFLPLTAGDFHSGWALDWSPELQSSPLPTPRQRRPGIQSRHLKHPG